MSRKPVATLPDARFLNGANRKAKVLSEKCEAVFGPESVSKPELKRSKCFTSNANANALGLMMVFSAQACPAVLPRSECRQT